MKALLAKIKVLAASSLILFVFMHAGTVSAGPSNPGSDNCSAAQLKPNEGQATCAKVDDCATDQGSAFNPTSQCLTTLPKVQADTNTIAKGFQVVFGVAAGVALITLGIAAFNFATIATDAEKISRSKKAIEFALVGLAITLLAEAIVTTVIAKL